MYRYYFNITMAKEIYDLKASYGKDIEEAIRKFNEASQSARTYKRIIKESVNIYDSNFEFEFETKIDLGENLSLRHLHLLSKYLLEVEGLNKYTINKRFLKPLEMRCLQKGKAQEKNLTDSEVIKYVIDLYFDKSNSSKSIFIKGEIKRLIAQYIE